MSIAPSLLYAQSGATKSKAKGSSHSKSSSYGNKRTTGTQKQKSVSNHDAVIAGLLELSDSADAELSKSTAKEEKSRHEAALATEKANRSAKGVKISSELAKGMKKLSKKRK
ncbi:MAG: hypothetical protein V4543_02385 [Bacteroidota bacterium]